MIAVAIKERPILMHARSIRGILEGRKTQTRRILKRQPPRVEAVHQLAGDGYHFYRNCLGDFSVAGPVWAVKKLGGPSQLSCRYGRAGDRLWVRERLIEKNGEWLYHGDGTLVMVDEEDRSASLSWAHHKESEHCQSIHMPRWACRLVLEITDIRLELVQDITEADIKAEGCLCLPDCAYCADPDYGHPRHNLPTFQTLWNDTNGKGAWERNDWVWCLSFQKA